MSMYPDLYDFTGMGELDEVLIAVIGVYLVILLLASIYSIVVYVLHSLGVYTIAKRRGIHHPWLAWLPVANVWVLGSVSDQYQYVAKNKTTNRRKVLLGLTIATYALLIPFWIVYFVLIGQMIGAGVQGTMPETMFSSAMLLLLISLVMGIVAVIQTVFAYIAYYDLFVSSRPNCATAFLILGIFFNFLLPYFVFACRKKDDGMPARQVPVQPEVPQYIPAPVEAEPELVLETEEPQEPVAVEEDFEPEEE